MRACGWVFVFVFVLVGTGSGSGSGRGRAGVRVPGHVRADTGPGARGVVMNKLEFLDWNPYSPYIA